MCRAARALSTASPARTTLGLDPFFQKPHDVVLKDLEGLLRTEGFELP